MACEEDGDAVEPTRPSVSATSLPCTKQAAVALDVPGPGQPTAEEAVAPYAGALTLVVQQSGGESTVLGLLSDNTVVRVFQVTKRVDGWWPDGYRECSG